MEVCDRLISYVQRKTYSVHKEETKDTVWSHMAFVISQIALKIWSRSYYSNMVCRYSPYIARHRKQTICRQCMGLRYKEGWYSQLALKNFNTWASSKDWLVSVRGYLKEICRGMSGGGERNLVSLLLENFISVLNEGCLH